MWCCVTSELARVACDRLVTCKAESLWRTADWVVNRDITHTINSNWTEIFPQSAMIDMDNSINCSMNQLLICYLWASAAQLNSILIRVVKKYLKTRMLWCSLTNNETNFVYINSRSKLPCMISLMTRMFRASNHVPPPPQYTSIQG